EVLVAILNSSVQYGCSHAMLSGAGAEVAVDLDSVQWMEHGEGLTRGITSL
ncbi:hypothetical protein M378DRAFT_168908, partial [Amanita muscaria Koide BX008]